MQYRAGMPSGKAARRLFFHHGKQSDQRHPEYVHGADREHDEHQRPAAAETPDALPHAKPEDSRRPAAPARKQDRERIAAFPEARFLQPAERDCTGLVAWQDYCYAT